MKVTFIQTGGTIDKDYPKTTKGYAFEITTPAVERILKNVNPSFNFEIFSVFKKDSTEITNEDRKKLLDFCRNIENDKMIITHGTDTMLETAKVLSELKDKVIVITGAMRPEKFYDSDASFNVGVAVGGLSTLPNGIYIAMHGNIFPLAKCERNLETGQYVIKNRE
jgi:L-asparaginase